MPPHAGLSAGQLLEYPMAKAMGYGLEFTRIGKRIDIIQTLMMAERLRSPTDDGRDAHVANGRLRRHSPRNRRRAQTTWGGTRVALVLLVGRDH